jgi:hypothetical protein
MWAVSARGHADRHLQGNCPPQTLSTLITVRLFIADIGMLEMLHV